MHHGPTCAIWRKSPCLSVLATGWPLQHPSLAVLFDQEPQALGQGANDNDTQLVGAVLWALWCLTLSMGALGMAYLSRAAWKMGRGSWWRGGVR